MEHMGIPVSLVAFGIVYTSGLWPSTLEAAQQDFPLIDDGNGVFPPCSLVRFLLVWHQDGNVCSVPAATSVFRSRTEKMRTKLDQIIPQQKSGRWKNTKKNEKKLPTLAVHIYIVYYSILYLVYLVFLIIFITLRQKINYSPGTALFA